MQLWRGLLKKFIADESGQSSTEYILILFLAFMVFTKIKDKLQPIIKGLTDGVENKSNNVLKDDWAN